MAANAYLLKYNVEFVVGDWLVEPGRDRLSRHVEEEYIEPKAMAVLVHLAVHAGEVVSGETLIKEVWSGRPLGDNPVYKCIARLRKIFRDDPQSPEYIATVPRKGYCLIAPIAPAPARCRAGVSGPALPAHAWPALLPAHDDHKHPVEAQWPFRQFEMHHADLDSLGIVARTYYVLELLEHVEAWLSAQGGANTQSELMANYRELLARVRDKATTVKARTEERLAAAE